LGRSIDDAGHSATHLQTATQRYERRQGDVNRQETQHSGRRFPAAAKREAESHQARPWRGGDNDHLSIRMIRA